VFALSYGRRVIYTDATEITPKNVVEEVRKALPIHNLNRGEIQKLYDYYRGKTAILQKKKEVREEINHQINENRAYEIVSFHKGYVFGEPIQYVRRETATNKTDDDNIASDINALNSYMADANKAKCDEQLAEWLLVAGTSYRLMLPNKKWTKDGDEAPFNMSVLDPRDTFIIYSNGVEKRKLASVCCTTREDSTQVYSGYTDEFYFEFSEFNQVKIQKISLGMNPIIEYPADNSRLGAFEIALPLLDALNSLQSNRMDDIVQYVNSFLAVLGAELDEGTIEKLNEWKTLCLPEGTDAKYLSSPMSQADIQTLKEDLYQSILTICAVPFRNNGSGGENGVTILLRDGYTEAEARAKSIETTFKCSEKEFLKLALRILRDTVGTKLRLTDITTHFTRRNYENIASKSQVLITMLNNPWVHPEVAYASCGMFPDPESAYLQGKAWHEEQEKKNKEKNPNANSGTDTVPPVQ
jgi:SPP1 family phage portal protein